MPDDLPIASPTEDSTKHAPTKPLQGGNHSSTGVEGEVRGGAETPQDPPIEQQKRQENRRLGEPGG